MYVCRRLCETPTFALHSANERLSDGEGITVTLSEESANCLAEHRWFQRIQR